MSRPVSMPTRQAHLAQRNDSGHFSTSRVSMVVPEEEGRPVEDLQRSS
jgi:hypothetical protein